MNQRWAYAVLVVVTLLAYRGSLEIGFLHDDLKVVVNNPLIRRWSALPTYLTPGYYRLSGDPVHYRPVATASHLVVYQLAGLDARAHHAANLVLHLLNAVLLLWLLRKLVGRRMPPQSPDAGSCARFAALVGALWFAIHPAISEAVLCVTFRRDALVLAGTLLALVMTRRAACASSRASAAAWLGLAALAQAAAIGSKETAVVSVLLVPLTLALLREPSGGDQTHARVTARSATALLMLVTAAYLMLRASLSSRSPVLPASLPEPGVLDRLALLAVNLRVYLQLLLWPWPLAVERPSSHLLASGAILLSVVPFALAIAGGFLTRWHPGPRTRLALAWLLLPLAPVLLFIPSSTAERYLYMPAAGGAMLIALGIEALASRLSARARPLSAAVAVAVFIALSGMACLLDHQIQVWKTPLQLWRQTASAFPPTFRTHLALAGELARLEDFVAAEHELRNALLLYPQSDAVLRGLAHVLRRRGRLAESDRAYRELLARHPVDEDGVAAEHAVLLCNDLGLIREAVVDLEPRVAARRSTAPAAALARIFQTCGLAHRARAAFAAVIALDPRDQPARQALLDLPERATEPAEELAAYRSLVAGEESRCQTYRRRGEGLVTLGRDSEALEAFRRALARNPGDSLLLERISGLESRRIHQNPAPGR